MTKCRQYTVTINGHMFTVKRDTDDKFVVPNQFRGLGTGTKPAMEPIILARKPMEGTVAANVLTWGTGGLNIDGCRITTNDNLNGGAVSTTGDRNPSTYSLPGDCGAYTQPAGRWPANVVLSHTENCKCIGSQKVKTGTAHEPKQKRMSRSIYGATHTLGRKCGYSENGNETIEAWACVPWCPVRMLDEQTGTLKSGSLSPTNNVKATTGWSGGSQANRVKSTFEANTGSGSRFFYTAKPSRREREVGLHGCESKNVNDGRKTSIDNPYQRGDSIRLNIHPTIKPVALMQYLVRLVSPPGRANVLDPFCGSGSTGIACMLEGKNFFGIEKEAEYVEIARKRIQHAKNNPEDFSRKKAKPKTKRVKKSKRPTTPQRSLWNYSKEPDA